MPQMDSRLESLHKLHSRMTAQQIKSRQKRGCRQLLLDFLADWKDFTARKKLAATLRRKQKSVAIKRAKELKKLREADLRGKGKGKKDDDPIEIEDVDSRPTQAQYMKYIRQRLQYCDANYDGNVIVTPDHALSYIQDKVFTDFTIKRIRPGAPFKGIVARLRPARLHPGVVDPKSGGEKKSLKDDEDEDQEKEEESELDDIMTSSDPSSKLGKWSSLEQPKEPKLDPIAWQIDAVLEDTRPERLKASLLNSVEVRGIGLVGDNGASISTAERARAVSRKRQDRGKREMYNHIPDVAILSSHAEKDKGE
ncbi:hypothetical protein BGZ47_003079 [Haplosporangium gracile]|nr:hypothetical protein BGZ47_003079 [Haplosporangium gracile]